jgi:hypothetical protein
MIKSRIMVLVLISALIGTLAAPAVVGNESKTENVSFDGTIEIAEEANNKHVYTYNTENLGAVSRLDLDLTGAVSNGSGSQSGQVDAGQIKDIYIPGNVDPTDVELTLSELEGGSTIDMTVGSDSDSVDFTGPGTKSIDVPVGESQLSFSGSGSANWELNYTEHVETENVSITINDETVTHDGSLTEGETVSLDADPSWIVDGTNTVEIGVAESVDGPDGAVGLSYSHTASIGGSAEVDRRAFGENYAITHTWQTDRSNPTVSVDLPDSVISVSNIEQRTNSGQWSSVDSYGLSSSGVNLYPDDVSEGDKTDYRFEAQKIEVTDGSIDITKSTVEGDTLATDIEVISAGEDFGIEVGSTVDGELVHYFGDSSWGGTGDVVITSSGSQMLRTAEANAGSTATVRTSPISIQPDSGSVSVSLDDVDANRFSIDETNADQLTVGYYDTRSGDDYTLRSVTRDQSLATETASSPVIFEIEASEEVYEVVEKSSGSIGGALPRSDNGGTSLLLLVPLVGISIIGLWIAGRRFGGATGVRGNGLLLLGSGIITVVSVEVATPRSLASDVVFVLGDLLTPGVGALLVSTTILVALWALNIRTEADVPGWLVAILAGGSAVMTAEAIRPGSILGTLQSVLLEVGTLLVLISVGVVIYWLRQRGKPDTTVTVDAGDQ